MLAGRVRCWWVPAPDLGPSVGRGSPAGPPAGCHGQQDGGHVGRAGAVGGRARDPRRGDRGGGFRPRRPSQQSLPGQSRSEWPGRSAVWPARPIDRPADSHPAEVRVGAVGAGRPRVEVTPWDSTEDKPIVRAGPDGADPHRGATRDRSTSPTPIDPAGTEAWLGEPLRDLDPGDHGCRARRGLRGPERSSRPSPPVARPMRSRAAHELSVA